MNDQTTAPTGPPKQFAMAVPHWWPRIQPVADIGDQVPEELPPEQAETINEMLAGVNAMDGTRLISVMLSAEEEPRPMGIMYVNHSENAGKVMSGLLGIQATPEAMPDLAAVGNLRDTHVEVLHFDTVGPVSCVSSRREPANPTADSKASFIRAYIIPEPATLRAALILYVTADHDESREPFSELCDHVTSGFNWRW